MRFRTHFKKVSLDEESVDLQAHFRCIPAGGRGSKSIRQFTGNSISEKNAKVLPLSCQFFTSLFHHVS